MRCFDFRGVIILCLVVFCCFIFCRIRFFYGLVEFRGFIRNIVVVEDFVVIRKMGLILKDVVCGWK